LPFANVSTPQNWRNCPGLRRGRGRLRNHHRTFPAPTHCYWALSRLGFGIARRSPLLKEDPFMCTGHALNNLRAQLCRAFGITILSICSEIESQGARHEITRRRSPSRRYRTARQASPSRDLEVSIKSRLVAALCRRLLVMLLTPMRRTVTKTTMPTRTANPPPHPLDADNHFKHAL
jgi:hypothetical protein